MTGKPLTLPMPSPIGVLDVNIPSYNVPEMKRDYAKTPAGAYQSPTMNMVGYKPVQSLSAYKL